MKKLLAFILVLCMCLTLVACGEDDNGKENNSNAISFQEQTIVDNEYCTIRITGIDPDNFWGYSLSVYLENKSPDTTYMMTVDYAAINGVSTNPLFAVEVAPGKKANESITFLEEFPEDIGAYSDILLGFRVYDSEDWSADAVAETEAHIYPYGESSATQFQRAGQSSDTVVMDNESIAIVVTGYRMDEIWGYTAALYIQNKTDLEILVSADDVSVNGYMIDPYFATSIPAGTSTFIDISWSEDDLSTNGITEVEKIEMKLRVSDYNDLFAEDIANETITLNP